jgi:hypothetical protein
VPAGKEGGQLQSCSPARSKEPIGHRQSATRKPRSAFGAPIPWPRAGPAWWFLTTAHLLLLFMKLGQFINLDDSNMCGCRLDYVLCGLIVASLDERCGWAFAARPTYPTFERCAIHEACGHPFGASC